MERRWYAVWDPAIPKVFEPEKALPAYFKDMAMAEPERIAVSFYGRDLTYGELDLAVERFAWGLRGLGIEKGDRIALFMQNCPQLVISYFGTLLAGAIAVSVNPMYKHEELEYQIRDSGSQTLVVLDSLVGEFKKTRGAGIERLIVASLKDYLPESPVLPLPEEMERSKADIAEGIDFMDFIDSQQPRELPTLKDLEQEIALLQYTGGTTGLPKGAMHTHRTLAHNVAGAALWFGYTRDDVHLGVMPFSHVQGMTQAMNAPLVSGGALVILSRFSAETVALAIERYKATVLQANTTMVIAMMQWPKMDSHNLGSLRIVTSGGAAMPKEVLAALRRMAPKAALSEGYGLTETLSGGGALTPPHRPKPGFIGVPFISTDVKIVDRERGLTEVAPGEEGEIAISGAT